MILREEDLKVLEGVPAGKWQEVMDFARYLIARFGEEKMPEAKQDKQYRSGGWVEGEIWMSDDFNDPMDFVSDDEMRVLEAMRESKREKLQEVAV